jgi:hypothetical protein
MKKPGLGVRSRSISREKVTRSGRNRVRLLPVPASPAKSLTRPKPPLRRMSLQTNSGPVNTPPLRLSSKGQ